MSKAKVHLFIDNSNIFISAKNIAFAKEGESSVQAVRLQFENLLKLAVADRELANVHVVGSIPPEQKAVWDRLGQATGVKPELYERGQYSGGEQGLDQCLQVHMLRAISDNSSPQIVVLMTGDGAGYDDGVGFHADMERMHAAGWGVEVVTWKGYCRNTLRKWATENGCFIALEDYYDSVTFLDGGRRSRSVDLSNRPKAAPKLTALQIAEQRAKEQYEKQIAAMTKELEEIKAKQASKERGKAKYEKRMAAKKK
jgi:hypothetical protein